MQNPCRDWFIALLMLSLLVPLGCSEPPAPREAGAPEVSVAVPEVQAVTDYRTFTGRIRAVEEVELRARVEGFLMSIPGYKEYIRKALEVRGLSPELPPEVESLEEFAEGEIVQQGALLFVIDPEQYQTSLDAARATLEESKAKVLLAQSNLARAEKLIASKAIPQEDYETSRAELAVAKAQMQTREATVRQKQIDLGYTEVRAPFTGLIDRREVDPGNLVGAGEKTLLTKIVRMDPMHVYFDVSEQVVLSVLQWRRERPAGRDEKRMPIQLSLENEEGFPHQGHLNYLENQVDSATGTALVRGVFANTDGFLYPGLFVRVRIPRREIPQAVLVHERALGTDLDGKYVLVVGDGNKVEQRPVKLGSLTDDGKRVILDGLSADETYIVDGLQRARPGRPVTPQPLAEPAEPTAPTTAGT